jgi:hypothetical protein
MGLLFVRDRGYVSLDVASPAAPGVWLGLSWVLEAIRGEPARNFSGDGELELVASILHQNFDVLAEALGPRLAETKVEVQRRLELRRAALVQRQVARVPGGRRRLRTLRLVVSLALVFVAILAIWIVAR